MAGMAGKGVGGGAVGGVGGENRAGRWEMEIRAILQLPKIPGTKLQTSDNF